MSFKQVVATDQAPDAIGPYSQANFAGGFVFTAGQIGLDPAKMELVSGGIQAETRQALTNLSHVLKAAGTSMENVVKTTVFLGNMNDFALMNGVYAQFFTANFPARSTIQAAGLPMGAAVEIEAIAAPIGRPAYGCGGGDRSHCRDKTRVISIPIGISPISHKQYCGF